MGRLFDRFIQKLVEISPIYVANKKSPREVIEIIRRSVERERQRERAMNSKSYQPPKGSN